MNATKQRPKTRHEGNELIAGTRLENLTQLISAFKNRSEFCRQSGCSVTHVSQLFQSHDTVGYRPMGPTFSRKVETALGLPRFCLDLANGVAPHLQGVAQRFGLAQAAFASQRNGEAPRVVEPDGLSPLQVATLDALKTAMKDGRLGNTECVQLLGQYVTQTA